MYAAHSSSYMDLNQAQLLKLKQRTMCALATEKVLVYDTLQQALDLPSIRELEDFIIQDCIYTGLLKCKLDQQGRRIHVQDVYNCDVQPSRLPTLCAGLKELCAPNIRALVCAPGRVAF